MKKLIKIVLGIIVLIVAVIVVYALFFDKVRAPQDINTAQSVPSDWQTYTDPVSGISLEAPANFAVTDASNTFSIIFPTTTPYVHTHLLHELRIDIDSPSAVCDHRSSGGPVATSTTSIIDGAKFTRGNWSDVGAGNLYQGVDYSVIRNGLCYRVTLFTHSTNGESFYSSDPVDIQKIDALQAIDIQDLYVLFDQVASTIKFTK